jgi:hypothetical protein
LHNFVVSCCRSTSYVPTHARASDATFVSPLFVFLTFVAPSRIWFSQSIRSPGPVSPQDAECEGFDLTYPRIASSSNSMAIPQPSLDYDVDKKVNESIQSFLMTLSQIGPELLSVSEI